MDAIDELSDAETTRLIIRLRRRLAEAERRLAADSDEAGVIAAILPSLLDLAASRPAMAPKLTALVERYAPLANQETTKPGPPKRTGRMPPVM